ncbi:MAG: hypothetical protein KDB35_16420 [Acidimicrobiales bacterium]|nr:hypothetical protein [Acidimicrobiales bacterium]
MPDSAIEVVLRTVDILDRLQIPYVVGGSLASSLVGEARSTADVDLAVILRSHDVAGLVEAVSDSFFVSSAHVDKAISDHGSFNLIDLRSPYKVDVFVLGDGLLDRRQIARRRQVRVAGRQLWITSLEDQVLRKLTWFRLGGEVSERQWRDVVSILAIQGDRVDSDDLDETAALLGLSDLLERARGDATRWP